MSQENVEIVRRAWDAITRRDLDGFLALMDSEVVAEPRILAVEGGALRGHDGIREWWESVFGAFPDFDAEVIEIREGGHMTTSNVRVRGRGAGSDVPFEDPIWHVSEWQDGKCVWWRVYESRSEALEAAGVSE